MTVPTLAVRDHSARARSLREWETALWWMGLSAAVLAVALFMFGMVGRTVVMLCLYWVIATARRSCGEAADRHADWLREDARAHHEVHLRGDV